MRIAGKSVLRVGETEITDEELRADEEQWPGPLVAFNVPAKTAAEWTDAELIRRLLAVYCRFTLRTNHLDVKDVMEIGVARFLPVPPAETPFGFTLHFLPRGGAYFGLIAQDGRTLDGWVEMNYRGAVCEVGQRYSHIPAHVNVRIEVPFFAYAEEEVMPTEFIPPARIIEVQNKSPLPDSVNL